MLSQRLYPATWPFATYLRMRETRWSLACRLEGLGGLPQLGSLKI